MSFPYRSSSLAVTPANSAAVRIPPSLGGRQRGAALVVGMIFLLITSLMAITAMSGVVMQERMAGNLRNVSIAIGGAESALRAGELYLMGLISRGDQPTGGCPAPDPIHNIFDRASITCDDFGMVDNFRSEQNWIENHGPGVMSYPVSLITEQELDSHEGAGMARRPVFIIEHMGVMLPGSGGAGREWGDDGGYQAGGGAGSGFPPPRTFRITARATGSTASVVRVAESYFAAFVGGGAGGLCPDGVTPPDEDGNCP